MWTAILTISALALVAGLALGIASRSLPAEMSKTKRTSKSANSSALAPTRKKIDLRMVTGLDSAISNDGEPS